MCIITELAVCFGGIYSILICGYSNEEGDPCERSSR